MFQCLFKTVPHIPGRRLVSKSSSVLPCELRCNNSLTWKRQCYGKRNACERDLFVEILPYIEIKDIFIVRLLITKCIIFTLICIIDILFFGGGMGVGVLCYICYSGDLSLIHSLGILCKAFHVPVCWHWCKTRREGLFTHWYRTRLPTIRGL